MSYPELPMYKRMSDQELTELYDEIKVWSAQLINELDNRDVAVDDRPAFQILVLTTTSSLVGRPEGGNIVYSASTGIYYGWDALTSAWDAMT
jgi:hypothetical protein